MNESFHYEYYRQEVIFAPGALRQLNEVSRKAGWERMLLCTSHSMRVNGCVVSIESALGDRLAGVFDRVLPHVPDVQVDEALEMAVESNISVVIGLGGGSPIGMAKAVAHHLEERRQSHVAGNPVLRNPPRIAVIAIPATYAGSEMTPVFGITYTHQAPARKITVKDPNITPSLVIYDPELTLDMPARITASTGINALAHCLEALYSITRNPLSTAAATRAVRHIGNSLLRCYHQPDDLDARSELLLGAHLAGWSLATVAMGMHHGLCHVLGGTAGVAHGIANSILLPHVIRFNGDATAVQLLPAIEVLAIQSNTSEPFGAIDTMAQWISELTRQMGLPQRLREVGVPESDLPMLARLGFQSPTVQNNPKPIKDVYQIEKLLREAW